TSICCGAPILICEDENCRVPYHCSLCLKPVELRVPQTGTAILLSHGDELLIVRRNSPRNDLPPIFAMNNVEDQANTRCVISHEAAYQMMRQIFHEAVDLGWQLQWAGVPMSEGACQERISFQ